MHLHFTLTTTIFMSLIGISTNQLHLMSTLLSIEAMTLILFLLMTLPPLSCTNMTMIPVILMALGACEASAGLTLMTITKQKNATDHMTNLNLLKC
uniref:NADH-ubiquinone oxidoreductase chain 4L n=1 Tax=Xenagama taylori TaxID=330728 RepID=Q1G7J5_9SAUR|nr:NADH dehydrogenase subunit 4L [Xenagama taylori]AAY57826.1 NADH dehydrogenase subunit 4L [Xenagama taylori]